MIVCAETNEWLAVDSRRVEERERIGVGPERLRRLIEDEVDLTRSFMFSECSSYPVYASIAK
jgi:hypothetical protein